MATVLQCDSCYGPRSRYSETGMCSKCEREEVDLHIAQCQKDIREGISIRHRMTAVLPNLCFNCMKPLEPVVMSNGRVREYMRKFCNRHCQYEYRKKNGLDHNVR